MHISSWDSLSSPLRYSTIQSSMQHKDSCTLWHRALSFPPPSSLSSWTKYKHLDLTIPASARARPKKMLPITQLLGHFYHLLQNPLLESLLTLTRSIVPPRELVKIISNYQTQYNLSLVKINSNLAIPLGLRKVWQTKTTHIKQWLLSYAIYNNEKLRTSYLFKNRGMVK